MDDLSGTKFGEYDIIAQIGAGGMATVYRAYQPALDRDVALKILDEGLSTDIIFLKRFRQEGKIISTLDHPHILCVHECGELDEQAYIVMPLLEDGSLRGLLKRRPLSFKEMMQVAIQIGSALDYAHELGLVHRDVKPENILLNENGNFLLCDFGVVKNLVDDARLTELGEVVGTPAYMSPEQAMSQPIDRRCDIYSLGVIMYEMAAGLNPFLAQSPLDMARNHIVVPPPPLSDYNPDVPQALEDVIHTCLAKERDQRYSTAGELVLTLNSAFA